MSKRYKKQRDPVKGMLNAVLEEIVMASSEYVSDEFLEKYYLFYQKEHVKKFSKRLLSFYQDEESMLLPKPNFESECTPPLSEALEVFKPFLKQWTDSVNLAELDEQAQAFAKVIEQAGMKTLLLILGQRCTPGSIFDERAIPPNRKKLLKTAVQPYNENVTIAARALSKHVHREDKDIRFWGDLSGSDERKNKKGRQLVERVLKESAWWNVFYHYSHGPVYEARVPTGQGARWSADGEVFIGFLEPFLDEERTH